MTTTTTIVPFFNNVLLRLRELGEASSIISLNPGQEYKMPYGEVLAVGPDCTGQLKKGDKALFFVSKSIPTPSPDGDSTSPTFIVPEQFILGKYEETKEGLN